MSIREMAAGARHLLLWLIRGLRPTRRPRSTPPVKRRPDALDFRGLLVFWINEGYELVVVDIRPGNSTTVRASLSRIHRHFFIIAAWNQATKQRFLKQVQSFHGTDEVADYTNEDILAEIDVSGATVRLSLDIVPVFPSGIDIRISIDQIEIHSSPSANDQLDDI